MCHDFNVAEFFMRDALPLWLEAEAHSSCDDDLPDSATCTIFFDRLSGRGTTFRISAARISDSGTYENTATIHWSDGTTASCGKDLVTHSFFERHDRSYRAEVDFVAEVLAGTRSMADGPNTPFSCLITAALVELAEESAHLGGRRLYLNRPFLVALHDIASEHSIALPSKL